LTQRRAGEKHAKRHPVGGVVLTKITLEDEYIDFPFHESPSHNYDAPSSTSNETPSKETCCQPRIPACVAAAGVSTSSIILRRLLEHRNGGTWVFSLIQVAERCPPFTNIAVF
jgi:hypothetical protein